MSFTISFLTKIPVVNILIKQFGIKAEPARTVTIRNHGPFLVFPLARDCMSVQDAVCVGVIQVTAGIHDGVTRGRP